MPDDLTRQGKASAMHVYTGFKIDILDSDTFVGCFVDAPFLYWLFWYRLFAC